MPVNLNKSKDVEMEISKVHGHKRVVFKFIDQDTGVGDGHQAFRATAAKLRAKSDSFCCGELEQELWGKQKDVEIEYEKNSNTFSSTSFRSDSEEASSESGHNVVI